MENKIVAILESFYSKRDKFGNCYWAFKWTDCASGKQVQEFSETQTQNQEVS